MPPPRRQLFGSKAPVSTQPKSKSKQKPKSQSKTKPKVARKRKANKEAVPSPAKISHRQQHREEPDSAEVQSESEPEGNPPLENIDRSEGHGEDQRESRVGSGSDVESDDNSDKNRPGPSSTTRAGDNEPSRARRAGPSSTEASGNNESSDTDHERRQRQQETSNRSHRQSQSQNRGRGQSSRREVEDDEEEEHERVVDGLGNFVKQYREHVKNKKSEVIEVVAKFKSKRDDPLRAELFTSVLGFVKTDIFTMKEFFPDLNTREFNELLVRTKSSLTKLENVKRQAVGLVEHILDEYRDDNKYINNMICNLQLKRCMRNRESVLWEGFELKKNARDPNHEFLWKPDDAEVDLGEEEVMGFKVAARSKIRQGLKNFPNEDGVKRVAQVLSLDQFIFIAVLKLKSFIRNGAEKITFTPTFAAVNPKFPYLFFHGKEASDELLQLLVESVSENYHAAQKLNLKDIGLSSVYTSCLKISSTNYREKVEEALNANQEVENSLPPLAGFEVINKRRKLMKASIDDKQEGGFKTMTWKIMQKEQDTNANNSAENNDTNEFPITIKFRAKKGNMDKMIATMFERGGCPDPSPYLLARDKKSNFLKLKYENGKGFTEYPNQNLNSSNVFRDDESDSGPEEQ